MKEKDKAYYTIEDIARMADVSISTVSRVLNNSAPVSRKTRLKVLKAIEEMNFIPNAMARGLVTKASKAIGLIVPDITNPFFPEIVSAVEDTVNREGFSVFLCNTNYNEEKELKYIEEMVKRRVDGIIIFSTFLSKKGLAMVQKVMPVVSVQTDIDDSIDCVNTTDRQGALNAIEYLISLGHSKIAMIGLAMDIKALGQRIQGYYDALRQHNIPIRQEYILKSDLKGEAGYFLGQRLLELDDPPTAIFALNDQLAIGAYRAIRDKGLNIPEDISVVGFDNIMISSLIYPPLTTVSQPIYSMGETAGELLISNINNGRKPIRREVVLSTKLITRASTAPPRNL